MARKLLSILFAVLAISIPSISAQEATGNNTEVIAVDPYPPYICQVEVKDNKNKISTWDVEGNSYNQFSFDMVSSINSPYCACLALAFDQPNFQGKYRTFPVTNQWYKLPFVAQSMYLTCGSGLSISAFKSV